MKQIIFIILILQFSTIIMAETSNNTNIDKQMKDSEKRLQNTIMNVDKSTLEKYYSKRILDRLSKLNHTKLEDLMQRVGKKAPKGYYQCLCNSYSTMGNSFRYYPNGSGECKNGPGPCLGGNWGCAWGVLPTDPKIIERCVKYKKYDDNSTILDAIVNTITEKKMSMDTVILPSPKIDKDKVLSELKNKNKKYEDLCLPSISIKNFNDMQRILKFNMLHEAADIMKETDNICEESVALNLFFNEQQSNSSFSTMYDIVVTWLPMTNAYDYAGFIGLPFASPFGTLVNADATVKIINDINKFKEIDIVFHGASELFQTSKKWNKKEINNQIYNLKKKINSVDNVMNAIEMSYQKKYHETRDEIYNREGKEQEGNAQWVSFNKKDKILRQKADERKKRLWLERTNFLLKSKVLTEYRLPLSQKSCAELLADRESECKKQKHEQAKVALEQAKKIPVREIPKDINPYHGVTDSSIKIMK